MEAIRFSNQTLYLLDQTALPQTERWQPYTDYQEVKKAISSMVVRGAPAIGIAAAYAVVLAARQFQSSQSFRAQMIQAMKDLNAARPTAVNLSWALNRMARHLQAGYQLRFCCL